MSTPVFIHALYIAAPGNGDEVARLLAILAEASRTEPGNISYEVFRSLDTPERFAILEEYVDMDAFDAHRTSEHFARIGRGEIIPLLALREVNRVESTPL